MNNKQFSKCSKCGNDEKYVVWVVEDKDKPAIEVKVCSKQCNINKRGKWFDRFIVTQNLCCRCCRHWS